MDFSTSSTSGISDKGRSKWTLTGSSHAGMVQNGSVVGSTPWTRVVLLTGLLTLFLAILEVFLMITFLA